MKYKLGFDFGWYKSSNFTLLIVEVGEHYTDWWTLFRVQIIKFELCIMLKPRK
jgi:hypothetical protein